MLHGAERSALLMVYLYIIFRIFIKMHDAPCLCIA